VGDAPSWDIADSKTDATQSNLVSVFMQFAGQGLKDVGHSSSVIVVCLWREYIVTKRLKLESYSFY